MNISARSLVAAFTAALILATASIAAHAETYPDRPIRLIVPFAAGTATDVIGRAVVFGLGKSLGTLVVDNRPGALGAIGTTEVMRAKPDGYTLLLGTSTSLSAGPQMLKQKPAYDAENDFIPIGRVAAVVFVLVARSSLGVKSLDELVELGGKSPKPLSWGYANSANLAAGTVLVNEAKFETIKVPYKGVPQLMQDLLGNTIDFAMVDTANALPLVKSGRLRALAVSTPNELPDLPGVPPMSRLVRGFELMVWGGLFAPRGTPEPIIALLAERLRRGMDDPEARGILEKAGMVPFYADRAGMRAYLTEDIARWAALIKAANIPLE